jgi:hypothetical protein
MKKLLYLFSFVFTLSLSAVAQDEQNDIGKVREKMVEYIQKRLDLSKPEAERFVPVFMDYFKDLRQTNQQYRGKGLELQQKIVELRLRYRDQFKPILGEKRSNDVFAYERDFITDLKKLREERLQERQGGRANKRF